MSRVSQHALPPSQRQLGGKLAGLSLPQQVMVLAMWPLLEQLLAFLVGFVDTALSGRLSAQAAAAVAIAAYIMWFMGMMQAAVGSGAAAVLARAIGAGHRGLAHAILGQAVVLAIIGGTLLGLLIYLTAPLAAMLMGDNPQSRELCVQYIRILSVATPFSAVLAISAACLRASGDTRTPFLVLVVVNIVNVTMSLLFVIGPEPIGGQGVAGIARGTVIAWIVGSVIIVMRLWQGNGIIRLRLLRMRPRWHTIHRILRIGTPNLFEAGGMWVGNILVMVVVTHVGQETAVGAHGAAIRLEALSFLPGFAMGMAASTLVGQYLGLGDPDRARKAVYICAGVAAGTMFISGLLFLLVPWYMARMVTDQPDLLAIIPTLLFICGPVQVPFGLSLVLREALRGAGDTRMTMFITWFTTFAIRVPGSYFVGVTLGYGLQGIWVVLCYEWVLRAALFALRFHHGGWARVKV